MSRCFPYPPPNYRKGDISKYLTTESIKLQKERDLTKERRKEKTEKKKERKEKRDKSEDKSESSKHSEHGHKKRKHVERNGLQTMDGYQQAAAKDVIDQLERSGLTEEHELPYPTQGPCESLESTQNSSKSRKLEATNVPGGSHGSNIFSLRVPWRKHRDFKPTPVSDEPCFSGRATCKDAEATLSTERDLTKERRKEKMEKKKERKEKRDKSEDKSESSKHSEHGQKKRKHDERNGLQTMDGYQKAAAKDVIEQLERSGLTEEHELPYPTQGPCESPESTQNSSKSRKLEATNVPGGSHGSNIFGLRVPWRKHRDFKPTPVNDEPCFSGRATCKDAEATPSTEEPCFSGRAMGLRMERDSCANDHSQYSSGIKSSNKMTEILLEQQFCDNFHGCSSSATRGSMTSEAPLELERQPSSTTKSSKPIEAPAERELVESSHSHSSSRDEGGKKSRKLERQFGDLVMNWKALPSLLDSGTEDLGWLYGKMGQHSLSSEAAQSCRVRSSIAEPSHGSGVSSYQTRACYLPELETYQLPYVVPF